MTSPLPPPAKHEPLVRRLGPWALWLLVINGMIGAGIFGIPARLEREAGEFGPWVFALCALLIAPIMLSFARLSSAFSGTGGPVLYARAAFGAFAGFQVGWAFYIARLTAFAANLNLLVTSIAYFAPGPVGPGVRIGLLLGMSSLLVWINLVGVKAAMRSLGVLTVLKLLPLVALAGYGLFRLDAEVFASAASPPAAIDFGAAVLLAIYAYVGFESGLVPGGESKNPKRDMPRAIVLALVVAGVVYVLVQIATRKLLPGLADSERPVVDAGEVLLGPAGALIVVLAIIASVGGNLLGSMFSTPRITYRLALDRQLPPLLADVDPKHNTPWVSVVVYGTAAFLLAVTGSFVFLAVLSVLTRLLIYITCIAGMPRIARQSDAESLLKLPGGPVIPVLALLVCVGLLRQVSIESVLATAALLGAGSVLFAIAIVMNRRTAKRTPDDPVA
ncbi:MAG: APC family permease [Phycisphaerales bacterium]|nr:APC family permease [Phycisphaerales bacterium]